MALSDTVVFNQYVQPAIIETLAQMVDKFNGATSGAIMLTTEGFDGDFLQESFWASIHSAQRRVDRYATNGSAAVTDLSQQKHSSVKVAGGFGPIRFEPAQMTWLRKPTAEGIEVISRNFAEAMMQDMLNSAIAAAVAAIEAQGADTVYDTGTGPITQRDLNLAHAKFGDASNAIVCNVVDGVTYHNLIDLALANSERLFVAQNVMVTELLGRRMVVTDAPALRETGTGADCKALGLVQGAVVVHDGGDVITNIETSNGNARIVTTFQADYTFGLGLKGYAWDEANGGKSPTDAEIATGSNWDLVATDHKHTAGVLALADV